MARLKRENTIIASFEVGKFVCEYDGNCWTVNSEDSARQFYYSSIESMCNALLNKVSATKIKDDFRSVANAIREAKQEILDALRFIDIKEESDK